MKTTFILIWVFLLLVGVAIKSDLVMMAALLAITFVTFQKGK